MDTTMESVREVQAEGIRIQPVILSGGAGRRLWPLSRRSRPKQLLSLMSEQSLLQETVARTAGHPGFGAPIIVCNGEHCGRAAEQLKAIGVEPRLVIAEPVGRNTAPALAATALLLAASDPDAVLLVQPSDHRIADQNAFRCAVERGLAAVEQGWLVTFGVVPDRPETGYGYIRRAEMLPRTNSAFVIDRFVEKPALDDARRYLAEGDYLWNSGIFLFSARRYLEELEAYEPKILAGCAKAVARAARDGNVLSLDREAFDEVPQLSIDYAVMERTRSAAVIPLDAGWDDVGSWRALRDIGTTDADGNVAMGEVVLDGVRGSYIRAEEGLVAALGVENVVVVSTGDAVLVASIDQAGRVGEIVDRLRGDSRCETFRNGSVHRPWGRFKTIDGGSRHQVKQIVVRPGGRLSLQMHHHRSEHWVIVSGTARVVCGDAVRLMHENESVYIPAGTRHRLENPGRIPLHVIEVQCGSYLGEDDIVRVEDVYGRS